MTTLYLFKAAIRGNIKRADEDALQSDIAEQLAQIPYFTLTENTVQVWETGDGELCEYTGEDGETLHQYTITIGGDIYAANEAAVRAIVSAFCTAYPDFTLVYRKIRATGITLEVEESTDETGEAEEAEETGESTEAEASEAEETSETTEEAEA